MSATKVIRLKGEWWSEDREATQEAIVTKRKLSSKYYTVAQVAERLNTSLDTIYEAMREKREEYKLHFQPIGRRRYRISEDDLIEYLEKRARHERKRR